MVNFWDEEHKSFHKDTSVVRGQDEMKVKRIIDLVFVAVHMVLREVTTSEEI